MRRFFKNERGYVETECWLPNCWINVECPDDDDVRFMTEELNVPLSFFESISDSDERPRTDHEDGWHLTIIRIPQKSDESASSYITLPLGIITKDDVIITVCYKETDFIPDFISHNKIREIDVKNESDFILRLIYSSAFWYLKYLKEISVKLKTYTGQLEKSVRNKDLLELMNLQETLVFFNTSVRGNEMVLGKIPRLHKDTMNMELFEDVEIELRQADNTIRIYTDILGSAMDSFSSVISNNVNDIMKKMTGVSIVLMIPTLVASFFGMNVDIYHVNNPYAFWVIIFGSLAVSVVLLIVLHKIRWF